MSEPCTCNKVFLWATEVFGIDETARLRFSHMIVGGAKVIV